ncbi:5-formyltetrahydrofolate cyclo-ligase [Aureimonas mangrovi]|uniref:5-formyltetrahydrofolate cyclo-ligase n=1 Tax=Aureimonas mangrovi TaxID=2758041 RepID=UPI00163DE17E|nr:5-formyltetrahydrofolate cyclo-ligase [Aureimonas mangrovi]
MDDTPEEVRSEAKARLRREALSRRDALGLSVRIEASHAIANRLAAAWPRGDFAVLGGYLPIRSEVDPRPAMERGAERGLHLCVPAIVGNDLDFRALEDGTSLEPQGFGTLAPGSGVERLRPDILLVPLVAFDARLNRIGYGGGFYDRAIAALRSGGGPLVAIGLAFAAQEVESVPTEPFDLALDLIVTEAGTVRP